MCGKFAIQLDSDDAYSDENTLQKIVDVFINKTVQWWCTYQMTDFEMNPIPPGIIDTKSGQPIMDETMPCA